MRVNQKGLDLIKAFEGLEQDAYLCPAGVPTIGYGHTGKDVKLGQHISVGEADELLLEDVEEFEIGVSKLLGSAPATSDQFSAMVCLAFNIGLGNFAGSTVLKRHKLGNPVGASKAFLLWNKAKVKGVLTALRGLTRRREAEAALYLGKR